MLLINAAVAAAEYYFYREKSLGIENRR